MTLLYCATQCRDGFAGDGEECELDPDLDAIPVRGLSCILPNCRKVCSIEARNTRSEQRVQFYCFQLRAQFVSVKGQSY